MKTDKDALRNHFGSLILFGLLVLLFSVLGSQTYADGSVSPPLINTVNGYAKIEREYHDAGNVILQRYLDADLLPVVGPKGYAEVYRSYDSGGHLI